MCGIAGIIAAPDAAPPEAGVLEALAHAMAHRGPDGSGHALVGRIALVHTRLAIIDLAGGDQPLFAGEAALVGNGEIYNYRELRRELPGVRFSTASDNEPPLHLWRREGAGFAQRLRGMYGIAIHDRAARTVTLARDPFGIKPLYIAQTRAGLAFASEARALLEAGIVPRAYCAGRRATSCCKSSSPPGRRRSSRASSGCCRAKPWFARKAGCWSGAASPPFPKAGRRRSARTRRWPGSTARWKKAWICTSAATCHTGCSCRAASTARRC